MKIKYLTLALLFGVMSTMNAQDGAVRKSNMGIKGGYNLAAVNYEGSGETGQRHGFHVGVYGESFISESFSIQPELM
jgi:hypothetical protein